MKKHILLIVAMLMAVKKGFAAGGGLTLTVDDLTYILYGCYAITGLAALLSLVSYFLRNKVLSFAAWLFTILAMPASLAVTFTAYGMFSPVVPFLSLFLLSHRLIKNAPERNATGARILRSISLLVLFFVTPKLLTDAFASDLVAMPPLQILFILLFNILLGAMVGSMIKTFQRKHLRTPGSSGTILWSVLIGCGTVFADINYTATWNLAARNTRLELHYFLFHLPYPNIFVNLACWICTALIVLKISWSRIKLNRHFQSV